MLGLLVNSLSFLNSFSFRFLHFSWLLPFISFLFCLSFAFFSFVFHFLSFFCLSLPFFSFVFHLLSFPLSYISVLFLSFGTTHLTNFCHAFWIFPIYFLHFPFPSSFILQLRALLTHYAQIHYTTKLARLRKQAVLITLASKLALRLTVPNPPTSFLKSR